MSDPYIVARYTDLQKVYDQCMQELPALNFTNCEAVLSWVEKMASPCDNRYVKKDKQKIISTFQKNRWHVGVNCGKDFKQEDKRNFAGWIVGQWLDIDTSGHVGLTERFIREWRNKFCK